LGFCLIAGARALLLGHSVGIASPTHRYRREAIMEKPHADQKTRAPDLAGHVELLLRPDELRRIAEEKELVAVQRDLAAVKSEEERQRDLYRAFLGQHLRPEAIERFCSMARDAAKRGETKIELLRFPSDWCTDRGRAINNDEEGWQDTLTGIAKEGYEAFDKWLRPLGYRFSGRIVDYPGGKPGDVALYISW